jgi:penicillin amidase
LGVTKILLTTIKLSAARHLAGLDRGLFVIVPGQSGNPLSRHARDFLRRWREGATVTPATQAATTESIRLTP